jgi:hypothetical protein
MVFKNGILIRVRKIEKFDGELTMKVLCEFFWPKHAY